MLALRGRWDALRLGPIGVLAGLAALVAVSLLLRSGELNEGFWIDEGLSVGIAERPISEIPETLRQDGSPPLYYMILNLWMWVFGTGEAATHALSLLFALAVIPVAWRLVGELFGTRAGWAAAVLFAVNPFLTQYAQETRMYSLVVLLGVIAATQLVAFAALGRRGRWPAFAVAMTAMLYTHNWSLFFGVACGLAWLGLVVASDRTARRAVLTDGIKAFGVVALLYLPWLPSLIFQAQHTGAPWALAPSTAVLVGAFEKLIGDPAVYVLLVASVAGLVAYGAALGRRTGRGARHDAPEAGQARAVLALIVVEVLTLVIAWGVSQVSPAWALRYLAVAVAPLLIVVAAMVSRGGAVGLAGLALAAYFSLGEEPPSKKSNVRDVAESIAPSLRPGDVVVSTQPEQIPVLDYYLPDGLTYATLWGPVDEVGVTDWRDGVERMRRTSPSRELDAIVDGLEPGARLVLVTPIVYDRERWSAPWTEQVRLNSLAWRRNLESERRLRIVAVRPPSAEDREPNPVQATIAVRAGEPAAVQLEGRRLASHPSP